jgi:NDP-sugar pyrophosphorylase family protein
MRAMILAAGLGTRLRPLTNDRPKALVEVAGETLLAITLRRLREFDIRDVIINVHHFADLVVEYLRANDNFGMRIEISREEELLDTGGGLKNAAWFFLQNSSDPEQPFLLHNVDVLSTIDFERMLRTHRDDRALATLAVQDRETSRYLVFDGNNELCGRRAGRDGTLRTIRPAHQPRALAFSGVHVISPRFLPLITETGVFSIIDTYLRLAGQGERILAFRADEYYWRDLGKPENIAQAEDDAKRQILRL